MQLPAQLPVQLPRCCYLAGDPVLEVEKINDKQSLIYHHGKERKIDARMLTDEAPAPRRPARLHPSNCAQHLEPLARARSLAREDQAREGLMWKNAKDHELAELIAASDACAAEVPQKARERLALLQERERQSAARAKRRAERKAERKVSAEREAARTADMRRRLWAVLEADIRLRRCSITQAIDQGLRWTGLPPESIAALAREVLAPPGSSVRRDLQEIESRGQRQLASAAAG